MKRFVPILVLASCSLIQDYPDRSAEDCTDRLDNDFDGLVDCDDLDCDGKCPEEDPRVCGDGRDNDGDGVIDMADARCWRFGTPEVERCASSARIDYFYSFEDDPRSDWFASPGAPSTSGGKLRFDPDQAIASYALFAGPWTGLHLEVEVSAGFDCPSIAFVPEAFSPLGGRPDPTGSTNLVVETGVLAIFPCQGVVVARGTTVIAQQVLDFSVDRRVILEIDAQTINVTTESFDRTMRATAVMPRSALPEEVMPKTRVAFFGGAAAWVDNVRIVVPGDDPCETQVPDIPAEDPNLVADAAGGTVAAADNLAGTRCALVSTCPSSGLGYSAQNGVDWTLSAMNTGGFTGAGVAWDPDANLWRAAYLIPLGGVGDPQVYVTSSADCITFTEPIPIELPLEPEGTFLLSSDPCVAPNGGIAYVVREVDGEVRHEIYVLRLPNINVSTDVQLVRIVSKDGAQWELDRVVAKFEPDDPVRYPMQVVAVGKRDVALIHVLPAYADDEGLAIRVAAGEDDTMWPLVSPRAVLSRSNVPGTFDRFYIRAGTIVPRDDHLDVLYSARGDFFPIDQGNVDRVGSARLRFVLPGSE